MTLHPNRIFNLRVCNYNFQLLLPRLLMHCTLSSYSVKISHNLGNRTQSQHNHKGKILFPLVLFFQLCKSCRLFYTMALAKGKVCLHSVQSVDQQLLCCPQELMRSQTVLVGVPANAFSSVGMSNQPWFEKKTRVQGNSYYCQQRSILPAFLWYQIPQPRLHRVLLLTYPT